MICIFFIIAFSMVKAESIPDQTIELLNITDSMYTSVLVPEERSQEYMVFPADNQVSRTKKQKAKAWQNTYKAQR
ncbi:Protein CBG27679 [Caenorhabditis briggsae]|uniref:Protein CBG27679 n=1 Tax=Caenorhabditis briggsae TaxID=6238 RepID=B6IJC4_CAEBR|nr:Protein CBG27679 [Caenorhabditis briggsae]CAR99958.1 Protein CBG27679 [Caenorhabditis briggsae]